MSRESIGLGREAGEKEKEEEDEGSVLSRVVYVGTSVKVRVNRTGNGDLGRYYDKGEYLEGRVKKCASTGVRGSGESPREKGRLKRVPGHRIRREDPLGGAGVSSRRVNLRRHNPSVPGPRCLRHPQGHFLLSCFVSLSVSSVTHVDGRAEPGVARKYPGVTWVTGPREGHYRGGEVDHRHPEAGPEPQTLGS